MGKSKLTVFILIGWGTLTFALASQSLAQAGPSSATAQACTAHRVVLYKGCKTMMDGFEAKFKPKELSEIECEKFCEKNSTDQTESCRSVAVGPYQGCHVESGSIVNTYSKDDVPESACMEFCHPIEIKDPRPILVPNNLEQTPPVNTPSGTE